MWEIDVRVQWDTETAAPNPGGGRYGGQAVLQRQHHWVFLLGAGFWMTGVCQELGHLEENSRQSECMDSSGEARCRLFKGPAQARQILFGVVEDVHRG